MGVLWICTSRSDLWCRLHYPVRITEFASVWMQIVLLKFLPVEEGLSGLALAPDIIVELQVVPIPMPWINLYNTTTYEHSRTVAFFLKKKKKKISYNSCIGSESCKKYFITLFPLNEKRATTYTVLSVHTLQKDKVNWWYWKAGSIHTSENTASNRETCFTSSGLCTHSLDPVLESQLESLAVSG